MNFDQLNALAKEIHTVDNHKWWHTKEGVRLARNKGELLMLMVSEVAEAMEGERKNLMDDKLPKRRMAEVEMSDVKIRLLDYAAGFNIILESALPVEMTENKAECLMRITGAINSTYLYASEIIDQSLEAYNLSSVLASCHAYCDKFGYDIDGAMAEKRAFNKVRVDHTYAAREAAGGKAF